MLPKFKSQAELIAFSSKLYAFLSQDSRVSGKLAEGDKPLNVLDIDAFLKNKKAKEELESKGAHEGPAIYLHSFLKQAAEILDCLKKASDESIERDARKSALSAAESTLSLLFDDKSSRKHPSRAMEAYLAKYGATQLTTPQVSFLAGLVQTFSNMHDTMQREAEHQAFAQCTEKMVSLAKDGEDLKKEFEGFVLGCAKHNISDDQLPKEKKKYEKEIESLDQDIADLSDEKKYQGLNKAAASQVKAAEKAIKDLQKQVDDAARKKNVLDQLVAEMTEWDEEVDYHIENEAQTKSQIADNQKAIDELEKMIAEEDKRVNEFKKNQDELKSMLKSPELQKQVLEYNDTVERYQTLQHALVEFERIREEEHDLNDMINEDPNNSSVALSIRMNPDILTRYYSAREDIIRTMNKDSKAQEELRKTFTDYLEKPGYIKGGLYYIRPENSVAAVFLDEYKEEYKAQLQVLQNRLNDMDARKDGQLKRYEYLRSSMDVNEKAESRSDKYREARDELLRENKGLTEYLNELYKYQETACKSFCKTLGVKYDTKLVAFSNWEGFYQAVKEKQAEQTNTVKTLGNSVEFQKLNEDLMKAKANYQLTLPAAIQQQLKIKRDAKEAALGNLNEVKKLQHTKERIYRKINQLHDDEHSLVSNYNQLKNKSFPKKTESMLISLHSALPKGNASSNSKEYNLLQERINNTHDVLTNSPEDKELLAATLSELKNAANGYLSAKQAQWRPWPFASNQRYARINGAQNLVSFCENAEKMMKTFTSREVSVANYLKVKNGKVPKLYEDEVFDEEMERAKSSLMKQGKLKAPAPQIQKSGNVLH